MLAPDSAPAELSEVEWRIYLTSEVNEPQNRSEGVTPMKISPDTPIPFIGYKALNEFQRGPWGTFVRRIQYRGLDGKWYPAIDRRKKRP